MIRQDGRWRVIRNGVEMDAWWTERKQCWFTVDGAVALTGITQVLWYDDRPEWVRVHNVDLTEPLNAQAFKLVGLLGGGYGGKEVEGAWLLDYDSEKDEIVEYKAFTIIRRFLGDLSASPASNR